MTLSQAVALPGALPTRLDAVFADLDGLDLATTMSLILILLYGGDTWTLRVPAAALCVCAFLLRPLRRSSDLWFALFLVAAVANAFRWHVIDNHKYLITWWCLALSMAFAGQDPGAALARSARWLLGLCFGFAMAWKLSSADFTSGAFFQWHLLMDARFLPLAHWVAGLPVETLGANLRSLEALTAPDSALLGASIQHNATLKAMAAGMTAWTLAIEGLVAVAFLAPVHSRLARCRDLALLCFVLSTYLLAPVLGFASVLLCLGAAQADRPLTRGLYALSFAMLQLYAAPWKELLLQLTTR